MSVSDLKAKAKEAFKRKNYDHAIDVYLEAIQFSPDDIELYEGLQQAAEKRREGKGKSMFGGGLGGLAIEAVRDPMKRIVACARFLAKNPGDKGVCMKLGDSAETAGHMDAAIYAFRTAAKADPDDNIAWKRLGALLYHRGRIPEAIEAYGEAVRLDPKDQEALKMRKNLAAEGALKTSGYETAKSSRELLRDKEGTGALERDRRIGLSAQDASDEAGRLRADIEKTPAGPGVGRLRVRLADLLLQKGDTDGALTEFETALGLEPGNYDLSVRIGDIKLARVQESYQAAKARRDAAPSDAAAGTAYETAWHGLVDARLAEYGRRVRDHPTDLAEHYKYGATLLMAGRVDEAIGEFQQTVRDPKRKTDSLLRMCECFEKKNLLDLAAKKLSEAAADFPTLSSERAKDVAYRLAELHERRGAKADARKEFERIYEVDIGYRDVAKKMQDLSA